MVTNTRANKLLHVKNCNTTILLSSNFECCCLLFCLARVDQNLLSQCLSLFACFFETLSWKLLVFVLSKEFVSFPI